MYCEFHQGYGYTYIKPDTRVTVNMDNLVTDRYLVNCRQFPLIKLILSTQTQISTIA